MTTRGGDVNPLCCQGCPGSLRPAGRQQGWSLVHPEGRLGHLSRGLGALGHIPPLPTKGGSFCHIFAVRPRGERLACVSGGSSVTWSCLPVRLPAGVRAKEDRRIPGASALGDEGPWRGGK